MSPLLVFLACCLLGSSLAIPTSDVTSLTYTMWPSSVFTCKGSAPITTRTVTTPACIAYKNIYTANSTLSVTRVFGCNNNVPVLIDCLTINVVWKLVNNVSSCDILDMSSCTVNPGKPDSCSTLYSGLQPFNYHIEQCGTNGGTPKVLPILMWIFLVSIVVLSVL